MSVCSGNCSSCGESCSDRKQESLLAEPNKNSQVKKVIAVVSGVGLIITKVISGFKLLKAGFLLAKGALTPLISSVWSFTAALLANPVTWIVIGIVALIAALVLLYNKCEWFRNAVNAIIDFFKEKLGAALEVASAIFSLSLIHI